MTNNDYAVAGIAGGDNNGSNQPWGNGVKLMALRIGWDSILGIGYVGMDYAADAFRYAADNGAIIVNASWGSSNSGGFGDAVDYFLSNGGLIFHAAGNDGADNPDFLDLHPDPNVLSVASTDSDDLVSSFSNFGDWVDVSAPGSIIWSTYHNSADPDNDYIASMSGTSMASPCAAGVAALIASRNPSWTVSQISQRLFDTADNIDDLNPGFEGKLGAGRVNGFNAVNDGANQLPTATITQPSDGSIFTVGQMINYAGDATDPEDGVLPASAFTWIGMTAATRQPIVTITGVKSGTIPIPPTAQEGDYIIMLEVEDSQGSIGTDEVQITLTP
jgi:subtilisin family serine protease